VSEIIKLSSPATAEFWEIPILYEDRHLLALDKPAGLLVSPDRYDAARPNLMKLLHRDLARGAAWAKGRGLDYLMNAHRLDFPTSGVLLLAKDKPTLVALACQFGSEKPVKIYAALVRGAAHSRASTAKPSSRRIRCGRPTCGSIRKTASGRARNSPCGRPSTVYLLLECRPLTGRTHQIRAHLKHLRLPMVGDDVYGGPALWLSTLKPEYRLKPGRSENPLISRVALHAEQLIIRRPSESGNTSGSESEAGEVRIEAPWPKDLSVAVKYLRRYAGRPANPA
jgi:23S rRNA-/tRNA-specific pseudouridylate synthase